jgi:hypothetical protein
MPDLLMAPDLEETTAQILAVSRPDLDAMNDLLTQEIAVSDSYRRVMELMPHDPCAAEWIAIRCRHQRAVTILAIRVRLQGGEPANPARAWRMSALTMFSTRPRTVLASLLRDLIRAEEHLARCYEEILEAEELSSEVEQMARNDFLPQCREHIAALERMVPSNA